MGMGRPPDATLDPTPPCMHARGAGMPAHTGMHPRHRTVHQLSHYVHDQGCEHLRINLLVSTLPKQAAGSRHCQRGLWNAGILKLSMLRTRNATDAAVGGGVGGFVLADASSMRAAPGSTRPFALEFPERDIERSPPCSATTDPVVNPSCGRGPSVWAPRRL